MSKDPATAANGSDIPTWIVATLFEPVFKEIYPDFRQCKEFQAKRALAAGENYATIMLRLKADIELNDGSSKTLNLMLKTALDSEMFREFMKVHNVFETEAILYNEVVPEFEQMYKAVGTEVKFGAKSYQLATDQPHLLLEDLTLKGFKNVNRLEGLDMDHTQCVLRKLAQWHAASAVRVFTKGPYNENICVGFFKPETREMMRGMLENLSRISMDCMKTFDGHELYYERMYENKDLRSDALFEAGKVDVNEFNVLNHGDCWANNVMFKHDAFGKVVETYLIDYQMTRYGSPAQDLYYFLLSSTQYELKIKHFDYFIKYYHDHLLANLQVLNYPKALRPTLKDIHIMLHKYNPWALSAVTGIMAAVLLDPQDDANLDNFMSDNDAGNKLKIQMYSNARYRKHCEMLLPWLYNRGAI